MQCYLCGSGKNHTREGKVRDNPNIRILECEECGLVFLESQETSDEFYKDNGMLGFEFFKAANREYNLEDLQETILNFQKERKIQQQRRFEFVKSMIAGKDILDFGSGYVGFLIQAQEFAKSVRGVELESQVAPIYKQHKIPLTRNLADLSGGGGQNMILSQPFM